MAADPHQNAPSGPSAEMQDQLQALARKLLDLWQDHVSALAQDPQLMAQALRLMAAYPPFPWPGMPVPRLPVHRPSRPGAWVRARCRST
jgi:hypothetical protein